MRHPFTADVVTRDTRAAIAALADGDDPIVVGPWLGEIGYELLYWIPFVRWALEAGPIDPSRVWVVSRGGCHGWYADLTTQYLDILSYFSPAEVCARNRARMDAQAAHHPAPLREGMQTAKQHERSDFDDAILAHVAADIGRQPRLLHPMLMYRLFAPYFRSQGPHLYHAHTRMRPLTPPPPIPGLPASYVAVKFYASEACRDDPRRRAQVAEICGALLRDEDVVTFTDATVYDEAHPGNFPLADHPRLHRVRLEPRTNLATQTAVIAHARAFLGTYGGFAYLAPLLGVRTAAFYAHYNFKEQHLRLAQATFARLGVRFTVASLTRGAANAA